MADYSIWVLEYCWVPQAPKGLLTHGAFNGGTVKLGPGRSVHPFGPR